MRRFEFVEGTSAKFWAAEVKDNKFVVVYGRLGTDGQRKEKDFPSADAAQREYDKKVAEKVREGYHEVAADAAQKAPAGAKGAAAAAPKLALPPRVGKGEASAARLEAAVSALRALEGELGGRAWRVRVHARKARRSLEDLGGVDPSKHAALAKALDAVLSRAAVSKGERALPLRLAMELLLELDVAAFGHAMGLWASCPAESPSAGALGLLREQREALAEDELALRFGALLVDRPERGGDGEVGWKKRWKVLASHMDPFFLARGAKLKDHLKSIAKDRDPFVKQRLAAMGA